MPYIPPPAMQFSPVNFGSMAPGGQFGQMADILKQLQPQPQSQTAQPAPGQPAAKPQYPNGMLGAVGAALQGNPQGGLAKTLFGGPNPNARPSEPQQMGLLSGLLQKLGGGLTPNGPAPTALTGLW